MLLIGICIFFKRVMFVFVVIFFLCYYRFSFVYLVLVLSELYCILLFFLEIGNLNKVF